MATKGRLRRKAVARNLAIGMKPEEALLKAGYSPTTARKKAYQVIRHPEVQSLLTESVARVLTEENKKFDDIVRPYVKALEATIVVKMPAAGVAVQTSVVDHSTRMVAATYLIGLYRPKRKQSEDHEIKADAPSVNIHIHFIETRKSQNPRPVNVTSATPLTSISPPKSIPPHHNWHL